MNTSFDPTDEEANRMEETLRVVAHWFEDDAPTQEPANLLGATLWRTARTRRRASWRNPERWLPVTLIANRPVTASPLRLVLILMTVALLTVALAAGASLVGSQLTRLGVPKAGPNALPAVALLATNCAAGTPLVTGDMATVAGNGTQIGFGDGGPATAAEINGPYANIAVDATGALYITDSTRQTVRRIGTDGVISTFVAAASFRPQSFPMGLAFDASGNLFVADPGNLVASYIWKVDAAGSATPIAGTGVFGSTGSEGPALSAEVEAAGVAVGPKGDLYFDDGNNDPGYFRTIDTAGLIHDFAGTNVAGFSGDGGPAVDAMVDLRTGGGIAADSAGNVYLGDGGNYRIRRVDPSGTITTVAGTGVAGASGDGGPAIQAEIGLSALAADAAGNVYLADISNNVVRKINTSGVITTIAGTGQAGFSGDCGPATSAQLNQPASIAIHDGILYIVDSGNNRVRMVVP